MYDRVRRGQLDGVVSGGMFCSHVAPSLRILRVLGLVHNGREAIYVINRLRPMLSREFEQNGFVDLGIALVGMDLLFSRTPVLSLDDMRRDTYWIWDADDMLIQQLTAMGIKLSPAPLPAAAALYESGRVAGFSTVPGAALAFQWSAQARHAAPLGYTALPGCAIVTQRAFDELPFDARQAIRAAGAKLQARFDGVTETQDAALLGGLFARQGLQTRPVSDRFREEFYAAAAATVKNLGAQLVPPELLRETTRILSEYRAQAGREGSSR
jgi:TRAP-type C4-dicarboxylate transport system substrate-binding protein